ncbi:MAG: hypothetical protein DLM64_02545 [Solirubrobacterales bacterium]|nr:MAG: hypothetical protein DLM64_02545 [Solirubrobacterales bacterium]
MRRIGGGPGWFASRLGCSGQGGQRADRVEGGGEPVPGIAVLQGLWFAIAIGIIDALTEAHRSLGSIVARAAIAGVIFGVLMWACNATGDDEPTAPEALGPTRPRALYSVKY